MPYKCKYFSASELVPRSVHEAVHPSKVYNLFDDRLLQVWDIIREEIDRPITVNNWLWGGNREWSGLRIPGSPYYRPNSQHTFGRALDALIEGMTAEEARQEIKEMFNLGVFKNITDSITLEDKVSWVHLDTRNNFPGFNIFQP